MRAILAERVVALTAADTVPSGRVGVGFDAHRLAAGRPMRVGGLTWPDEPRGPLGHSDGDAAIHAVIDALLGAAGLGDVGALFPPDETAWDGVDSAELLSRAAGHLDDHGWRTRGVDLVVAVAQPVIAARREEMAGRIAGLLDVPPDAVSVKGTTSDGLGFAGQEGVAAWAVATVERAE
jgi:2-C-methyl-D-erythritol 2,4-cyclodiphosphate synthase